MIIMGEFTNRLCVVGLPSSDNKAEEATIDLTIGVSFDGTLILIINIIRNGHLQKP